MQKSKLAAFDVGNALNKEQSRYGASTVRLAVLWTTAVTTAHPLLLAPQSPPHVHAHFALARHASIRSAGAWVVTHLIGQTVTEATGGL